MFKIVVLVLFFINFAFATNLKFEELKLDSFKISGISSKITNKNKKERNKQILELWSKFLSSKSLSYKENKKLYVLYYNYKINSFECFIGIKENKTIQGFKTKEIKASKYFKTSFSYKETSVLNKAWDNIEKKKLDRTYKIDFEEYNLFDIIKNKFDVNIYLSK